MRGSRRRARAYDERIAQALIHVRAPAPIACRGARLERTTMRIPRVLPPALILAGLLARPAAAGGPVTIDGYLEFKKASYLIVDAQRVEITPKTMLKAGKYKKVSDIPLGYRIKAKGTRSKDGTIDAAQVEATKNGSEFMEKDVLAGTDQAEKAYVQAKKVSDVGPDGKEQVIGALKESGPEVDRCRRIVDRLLPSYVNPKKVRVYVVDNPEWNAMAMANFSIYVYSGLMKDLDDDEMA